MATAPGLYDEKPKIPNPVDSSINLGNQISNLVSSDTSKQINPENVPDYLRYNLSESNALPWQRYLSDDVAKGVDSRFSSGQDAADLSRGLDKAADLGQGDSRNPMADAINRKYEGQVGDKLQSVKSGFEAERKDADELGRASTMLGQGEKIRMQNFKEQYDYQQKRQELYQKWKQAQDQAAAGFFTSVLSTVGTVAGAAVGTVAGGPAGGVAGAAAGGAVGRAAGGG